MARRFPLRAGFTALLAATAMTLGCLAAMPASASASVAVRVPAWHVVYRQANLDISGVTAGGPDDAWAYGTGKLGGGKLLHWNGISWAPAGYPHQNTYDIRAAFVLSPTDVWFAGNNEAPPLELASDPVANQWRER